MFIWTVSDVIGAIFWGFIVLLVIVVRIYDWVSRKKKK